MFINLAKLPLGKQILIKRILYDVGQQEFAKAIGINNSLLSKVEKGKEELPQKYMEDIKQFLNS